MSPRHNEIHLSSELLGTSGEPLLLIAGLAADKGFWHDGFCAGLVRAGFHVARFDNRDCGGSTHCDGVAAPSRRAARRDPRLAPYRLEDMAADTAALLDRLGWACVHVVGHSMGAMIAQRLAVAHPARVRSLTCIASTTSADVGRLRPSTMLRLARATPGLLSRKPPGNAAEAGDWLVRQSGIIGSPGYPPDEDWLRRRGETMYAHGGFDLDARARQAAAMMAAADCRPGLAQLRVPAVVVHGADDPLIRPSGGRAVAAAIPGAELVLLPGMAHDLPEPLWPRIIEEITAVAARGGG
ncbi:alpha/beta fold hydrolase [Mycobacterium sp.]|uniref:alpha/beta fold hydrolase n=1 Tax=Mycobacterium sp. TaxID=1785 RepID=UPI003A8BBB9E